MMSKKNIPIQNSEAEKISKKYNYPEIVIFAYDPDTRMQHVTTYGETKEQCLDAARAGNYLKKTLGWPEELCHTQPEEDVLKDKPNKNIKGPGTKEVKEG